MPRTIAITALIGNHQIASGQPEAGTTRKVNIATLPVNCDPAPGALPGVADKSGS